MQKSRNNDKSFQTDVKLSKYNYFVTVLKVSKL